MPLNVKEIDPERPVLIAGPTASGKSALALEIAEKQGGIVVNADALQVYANWRVLTARPPDEDLARAPHALYGHIGRFETYSVGHWLREIAACLAGTERLIITGGTGLYFTALTEGLAEIPPVPAETRAQGDALDREEMLAALDAETRDRIDPANRARVQRAWEVLTATGRGLASWQVATPPPLLPLATAQPILVDAPRDWLTPRIERRFDLMLAAGALDEARANLDFWDPALPSSRAIGAPELIAHLRGEMDLDAAREAACIATRRYAKRQRTWFRARMKAWRQVSFTD
ncbi:tRNA (adenosine(37)-N6)-dimethylallyltransferase MiaA [Tropicimonas sp. TH_r6]|uniref:tRNA (adenosine(37)-N6)-dimethylallyltransferase MiaA n=1 Tax=Tropicimonas sp. TH_r6 TaxID=3082085 RepID=UPI0029542AE5|nr:tRNA (adenosine(37)-N6)-dimethylallyltransferase MiaA [Tropicimonas sp. TH_r6]MDV7141490.1 tRNA (adenosine(37)-N6)-dimethylallyltransferase MiaA [Tropicimonas sp. TH_r6]